MMEPHAGHKGKVLLQALVQLLTVASSKEVELRAFLCTKGAIFDNPACLFAF